jgi:hypothetical protein
VLKPFKGEITMFDSKKDGGESGRSDQMEVIWLTKFRFKMDDEAPM